MALSRVHCKTCKLSLCDHIHYIGEHDDWSILEYRSVAGKVPKQLQRRCDTPASALGAVLTDLRLAQSWGYEYVSHKVGCTPGYMNEMEHGKRNPTLKVLQAIADLHGVKLSRLIAMAERLHERGAKNRAAGGAAAAKSGKKTR